MKWSSRRCQAATTTVATPLYGCLFIVAENLDVCPQFLLLNTLVAAVNFIVVSVVVAITAVARIRISRAR